MSEASDQVIAELFGFVTPEDRERWAKTKASPRRSSNDPMQKPGVIRATIDAAYQASQRALQQLQQAEMTGAATVTSQLETPIRRTRTIVEDIRQEIAPEY